MEELPKKTSERIVGKKYLSKGIICIWNGKELRCEHNRRRNTCRECGGSSVCIHGKQKLRCVECGGSQICIHNKRRSECRECGGGSICSHGIKKSQCGECGGSQICEHGRQRSFCKECDGGHYCPHGKLKSRCAECEGSQICEHGKMRHQCAECDGSSICEHNRRRITCMECDGNAICEHEKVRYRCMECEPSSAIAYLLRQRIHDALKGRAKGDSLVGLLGCTIESCRDHLSEQFEEGMSWQNHGEWHIDHRRPCASFDLTNEEEQKMCFHYTNLQPMWASDNLSKQASFDESTYQWIWNGNKWIEI